MVFQALTVTVIGTTIVSEIPTLFGVQMVFETLFSPPAKERRGPSEFRGTEAERGGTWQKKVTGPGRCVARSLPRPPARPFSCPLALRDVATTGPFWRAACRTSSAATALQRSRHPPRTTGFERDQATLRRLSLHRLKRQEG